MNPEYFRCQRCGQRHQCLRWLAYDDHQAMVATIYAHSICEAHSLLYAVLYGAGELVEERSPMCGVLDIDSYQREFATRMLPDDFMDGLTFHLLGLESY